MIKCTCPANDYTSTSVGKIHSNNCPYPDAVAMMEEINRLQNNKDINAMAASELHLEIDRLRAELAYQKERNDNNVTCADYQINMLEKERDKYAEALREIASAKGHSAKDAEIARKALGDK
jgi:hypothetical protein